MGTYCKSMFEPIATLCLVKRLLIRSAYTVLSVHRHPRILLSGTSFGNDKNAIMKLAKRTQVLQGQIALIYAVEP